jgi:hypothetical protein
LRAAAARARWRNPFRPSGLHAIIEEPEDASIIDEMSEQRSSHSQDKGEDVLSEDLSGPSPGSSLVPEWIWDATTRLRFRRWLMCAAVALLLLLLIILVVLLAPVHPPRPAFVREPQLKAASAMGDMFSLEVQLNMHASVHYVVVTADALDKAAARGLLNAGAVVDAAQPGPASELAAVRFHLELLSVAMARA